MNGYLIYEGRIPNVGLQHAFFNLKAIITEAVYLNRIPIIRPLRLHPKHNFGVKLNMQWSKYWDLNGTEVYIRNDKEFERVQEPFSYILEEDFDHLNFCDNQVHKVNHNQEIGDAENDTYDLIVRSVNEVRLKWWWSVVPDKMKENVHIKFKVADEVARISKNITERLGGYSAVHVRRRDRLKRNKNLKKFTSPQHIFKTLKDNVSLNSNVYIMTDERNRNYFDHLREHFRIFQYFDFNELDEIVSGKQPDNNFLYLIETRIFDNAAIKIATFNSRIHFDKLGDISSLSKYSVNEHTLTSNLRRYISTKKSPVWKPLHRFLLKRLRI